jgi:hypothetical protein
MVKILIRYFKHTIFTMNSFSYTNDVQDDDNSMTTIGGLEVKQSTAKFLNAVLDPFKCNNSARVPDLIKPNSICMRDYIDNGTWQSTNSLVGIMLYWHWGTNKFFEQVLANGTSTSTSKSFYNLIVVEILSGTSTAAGETFYLDYANCYVLSPINVASILPLDSSWYGTYDGLAESIRVFAGGVKVLPMIETITSSDTPAIRNLWAGNVAPIDLANHADTVAEEKQTIALANGNVCKFQPNTNLVQRKSTLKDAYAGRSLISLVRNSRDTFEFPNNQGATARYNPFQFEEQLEMVTADTINLEDSVTYYTPMTNQETGRVAMPFVLVEFNQTLDANTVAPLKYWANYWMECGLLQPTPIFSTRSPSDGMYDQVRAAMGNTEKFPVAVSGHSFRGIRQMAGAFTSTLGPTLRELRKQPRRKRKKAVVRKAAKAIFGREVYDIARLAGDFIPKSKSAKRRARRKRARQRSLKVMRNGMLPGNIVTDPRINVPTPNI